jgi:hypothetical protein
MRRNASTVVVLAGAVPEEVMLAAGRSMNVALIRPEASADGDSGGIEAAAAALGRAGRATSPYVLVAADPLAAVAAGWRAMWDVARQPGPAEFEQAAVRALAMWRAGAFELPDYYLVLTAGSGAEAGAGPDFHLGPLRSARPNRVAFVAAAEPAEQAVEVLQALGSLRHGPWWPGLDELIETARGFYPDSLASGHGESGVGGLDVLVEPTVHP